MIGGVQVQDIKWAPPFLRTSSHHWHRVQKNVSMCWIRECQSDFKLEQTKTLEILTIIEIYESRPPTSIIFQSTACWHGYMNTSEHCEICSLALLPVIVSVEWYHSHVPGPNINYNQRLKLVKFAQHNESGSRRKLHSWHHPKAAKSLKLAPLTCQWYQSSYLAQQSIQANFTTLNLGSYKFADYFSFKDKISTWIIAVTLMVSAWVGMTYISHASFVSPLCTSMCDMYQ